jgi:hypothetical protein
MRMCDTTFGIYPVWLCPARHLQSPKLRHLAAYKPDELLIDVGIYG